MASRFRRHIITPHLARPIEDFEQHKQLLQPLMDFVAARGRLPADDELANVSALRDVFGTIKRAFRVIQRATEARQWDEIAAGRAQDILIYLALSRFDGRPSFSRLPRELQLDIKGFFSSYASACGAADKLLFSVGDINVVNESCTSAPIGKLTQEALYVHESAIERLPPVLRVFEGCARGYIGRVEGANIIKLNRHEPKISYLSYPDFFVDPHPALASSLSVHLQTFRLKTRDYSGYRNPPILHRKETFLSADDPHFAKFARFTRIEEKHGLYEDVSRIGTREGWNVVLKAKGLRLKGHRVVRANVP
jgi:DNA phosphorothioation-associated putative methyltransferase